MKKFESIKRISLTHGKFAIVDDEDYEWLSQWKWYYAGDYARRYIYPGKTLIIMHRLIAGTPKGMETDHINHNKLDNRRCNLRICTKSQNRYNRMVSKGKKFKGVRWKIKNKKWESRIRVDKNEIYLGLFRTIEEAALAYNRAAKKYFGEYANLNVVA